jgi:hypothetical protein
LGFLDLVKRRALSCRDLLLGLGLTPDWLAAGGLTAGSCLRGKPMTFFMLRPMLTQ